MRDSTHLKTWMTTTWHVRQQKLKDQLDVMSALFWPPLLHMEHMLDSKRKGVQKRNASRSWAPSVEYSKCTTCSVGSRTAPSAWKGDSACCRWKDSAWDDLDSSQWAEGVGRVWRPWQRLQPTVIARSVSENGSLSSCYSKKTAFLTFRLRLGEFPLITYWA